MPRRTNDFQTLIALIERQLAQAGVVVTESKMVKDEVIGADREVDVHLVINDGRQARTVGIECVDRRRRADIDWVEGRIQKHRDLGTDHLVLVSKSGFTKVGRKKAKQHGALTLTLERATATDWASLPKSGVGLRIHELQACSMRIALPYDSQLEVEVPKGDERQFLSAGVDLLQIVLYEANGSRLGAMKEVLEMAVAAPEVRRDFERRTPRHGDEAPLHLHLHFPQGCYWVDEQGQRHGVVRLSLRGVGRMVKEEIPVSRGRYREALVLSGAADVSGSRIVMAGVQASDTRFSLGISPSPGSEPLIIELEVQPAAVQR